MAHPASVLVPARAGSDAGVKGLSMLSSATRKPAVGVSSAVLSKHPVTAAEFVGVWWPAAAAVAALAGDFGGACAWTAVDG